jgi:hypothetical protein
MAFSKFVYDFFQKIDEVLSSGLERINGYKTVGDKVEITSAKGYDNLIKVICPEAYKRSESIASTTIYGISDKTHPKGKPFLKLLESEEGRKLAKMLNLPLTDSKKQ